jgi:protein disulfide-isomerase
MALFKKLILFFGWAFWATTAVAFVNPGDPVSKLLDEHGEPSGKIDRAGVTFFSYPQGVIQVKEGIVVSIPDEFYGLNNKMVRNSGNGRSVEYVKKPLTSDVGGEGSGDPLAESAKWWQIEAAAKKLSSEKKKPLFMLFTGSDWCIGCRLMKRDIFDTTAFKVFASEHLVLLKVDFPKETPQTDTVRKQNDALHEKWMVSEYPTIILLDVDGSEIQRSGYSDLTAEKYVESLKKTLADWEARPKPKPINTAGDYMENMISDDIKNASKQLGILDSFGGSILKLSLNSMIASVLLFYLARRIFRKR